MKPLDDAPRAAPETVAEATRLLAETRSRCVALGLTPREFAELLLPEALLAMMVSGMTQEEVQAALAAFASDEVPEWFLQVKRTAGYCDCEREAFAEHGMSCSSRSMPVARQIADALAETVNPDGQDSRLREAVGSVGVGKDH